MAVVWGLERFRLHLYGKQVLLISDHQALEPLVKKNKTNKQNSTRQETMAKETESIRHNPEIHWGKNQFHRFY